jgi:hypothetical protein
MVKPFLWRFMKNHENSLSMSNAGEQVKSDSVNEESVNQIIVLT